MPQPGIKLTSVQLYQSLRDLALTTELLRLQQIQIMFKDLKKLEYFSGIKGPGALFRTTLRAIQQHSVWNFFIHRPFSCFSRKSWSRAILDSNGHFSFRLDFSSEPIFFDCNCFVFLFPAAAVGVQWDDTFLQQIKTKNSCGESQWEGKPKTTTTA